MVISVSLRKRKRKRWRLHSAMFFLLLSAKFVHPLIFITSSRLFSFSLGKRRMGGPIYIYVCRRAGTSVFLFSQMKLFGQLSQNSTASALGNGWKSTSSRIELFNFVEVVNLYFDFAFLFLKHFALPVLNCA